jgi:hypothetical protein
MMYGGQEGVQLLVRVFQRLDVGVHEFKLRRLLSDF